MAYPIKMLRDEERKPFIPYTSTKAVTDGSGHILQDVLDVKLDPVDVKAGNDISVTPATDNVTVNWVRPKNLTVQNNVTTTAAGNGVLDAYQGKVLNDKFNNYILSSEKGQANGVATLDNTGIIPAAQLPSYVDDVIEAYIVSGSTALSSGWLSLTESGEALTPEKGKIYVVLTSGQYQDHQYRWGGSTYVLCNPSDVNSVNGKTGVVVLDDLTIQKNGVQVGETYNGGSAKTINLEIPTKTSDITNDSGFVTTDTDITGNAATATNATNDKDGNQIDITYVKKAGDTMSGILNLPKLVFTGTSDGVSINSQNGNDMVFNVTGDTSAAVLTKDTFRPATGVKEQITLGTSDNKWKALYALNMYGNVTGNVTGNVIGDVTGDVTGDVSGNAGSATQLKTSRSINGVGFDGTQDIWTPYLGRRDFRNGVVPKDIGKERIVSAFATEGAFYDQASDGKYVDALIWNTWADSTGGDMNALVITKTNPQAIYHYRANVESETWTSKKQIAYTDSDITGKATTAGTADKVKEKLTVQKNGTTVVTFDGSEAKIANITVPTKVTDLTDNTNYVKTTDKASTTQYGIIKLGTGLAVNDDGVTYVTGEGVLADSVEWTKVANKPTDVSYWNNDAGYITTEATVDEAKKTTGTLTIQKNGTTIESFNGSGNVTANIVVPTKLSEFTDDLTGYVKKSGDTMTGVLAVNAFGTQGQFIMRGGTASDKYTSFWRNDGVNTYLLMTNVGDHNGTYNSLRPFWVSNSNGAAYMMNGLTVSALSSQGSIAAGTNETYKLALGGGSDYTWIDCRLKTDDTVASNIVMQNNGIIVMKKVSSTVGEYNFGGNHAGQFLNYNAQIKYNSTDKCIEFIFN